jgi:hypothetical protein
MKPHLGDTLQLDGGVRGKKVRCRFDVQTTYADNNHAHGESKGTDQDQPETENGPRIS